jgi:hypothetical protein
MEDVPPELCQEMGELRLKILPRGMLNELRVQYNLKDRIRNAQLECLKIWEIRELMKKGKLSHPFNDQMECIPLCVPRDQSHIS